jgi:NitT/TauT family transport system substrate-binding protein
MRDSAVGAAVAAVIALLAAGGALADGYKLRFACTPTSGCLSALVARDEGIFAAHGIDAEFLLVQNNIPPAIVSGSVDIGSPTVAVFLQAVDGGLDLEAIAGGTILDPVASNQVAVMARTGLELKEAKDFVGKKVGTPGLGALLHVLFRKWLIDHGVDPGKVNFVEVSFPNMSDALKSGSLDAVLAAEPFTTRIAKSGSGEIAAHFLNEFALNQPSIAYIASRSFVEAHPDVVRAFRESIAEAAPIVNSNRDKASASLSKFNKVPIEIVKLNRPDIAAPALKPSDFDWWIRTLKQQDMLQTDIDLGRIASP